VERITALPGVTRDANICGLTYKETSTIARLRQRGYANAICLDVRRDLGVLDPAAGVETVQEQISTGVLNDHAGHRGRYQVVIARHILEHAHDLLGFVAGLRGLLAADGYLIFEVPNFTTRKRVQEPLFLSRRLP
jgi:2-polyprenyl-3-methyl-5-hydroxy-6-metoxy-1,4-benzoquinol methylase